MKILKNNRRGAALVEFTVVLLLLITLVFGIIEMGLLIKDYLTLSHAAREGARSAAIGSPVQTIKDRIMDKAAALEGGITDDQIDLKKRSDPGVAWGDLGDSITTPDQNDAATGDEIRVKIIYPHQFVAVGVLPFLGDADGLMNIAGEMIMSRE